MVRLRALLLATLLLLSAPAVSVGGVASEPAATDSSALQQSSPANTSSLLELDEVEASNVTRPESSLATELSMQGSELDGRFAEYEVQTRLANLDGEARVRYALNETTRLQAELDRMLAEERRVRRQYVDGETSAAAYVETLARLDAQAESLAGSLDAVSEVWRSTNDPRLDSELGSIRTDLVSLEGPVRQRASDVIRGDGPSLPVHVTGSTSGITLSTVQDGAFYREAYRQDLIATGTPRPGISETSELVNERYPWVTGSSNRNDPSLNSIGATTWSVQLHHSHGRLTTYFYGNATAPYREVQYKTLSEYPFEDTQQTFDNDRILSVSPTYPGGPLEVNLTNQTGTPLDGEVRVNGSVAGRTGDDGLLWLLQPTDDFTVNVVHEGERISLDLAATGAEFGAGSTGG